MNNQPTLFEKAEKESSALEELQKIQTDPMVLISYCQNMIAQQAIQIKEMKPKVEMYDSFLGSTGEVDCKVAAGAVNLYYITPQGKKVKVDRNYFIQILKYDKIIYNSKGYKLSASHKAYGKTQSTNVNGFITNKVVFNSKGIDYLVKKYKDDKRIWRAIDGQLYCEEA